ncbi:STAS domain-containing protein [Streptosporangium sp. NPDC023963]|uniref:STAS domain-containing protein n=1 Tax=Streptosporangium sp. NPDC023963 TaxID=3155608 RepID=UPI0034420D53
MASLSPSPQVLSSFEASPSFETPPETFGTSSDTQAQAGPWLILDLQGLTFCDSTGLAELLWLLRRSQETRTRLVLAGASRTLRHMMATTGLLTYFTMAASVEEALPDEEFRAAEGH